MLEPVALEAQPAQGCQVGELEAPQPPDAVVLQVEGVQVGQAVEGLGRDSIDIKICPKHLKLWPKRTQISPKIAQNEPKIYI